MACANLIHASVHWPESYLTDLWPFAMSYAVWVYNRPLLMVMAYLL
jgi:hypothetical protein